MSFSTKIISILIVVLLNIERTDCRSSTEVFKKKVIAPGIYENPTLALREKKSSKPLEEPEKLGVRTYPLPVTFFHQLFGGGVICDIGRTITSANRKNVESFLQWSTCINLNRHTLVHLFNLVFKRIRTLTQNGLKERCSRLFATSMRRPTKALPSIGALIKEYKKRAWSDEIEIHKYDAHGPSQSNRAKGYVSDDHEGDQRRLLKVVKKHNQQFAKQIELLADQDEGIIERHDVSDKTKLFVRADLHSDLPSLLAQLSMLRKRGLLDKDYKCAPKFEMIFLGDYMNRGANDIEVMTLLLLLRMKNPTSVHLIRGNHENIEKQKKNSNEGPWLKMHEELFSACYKSMPLAICVGEASGRKDKNHERQYVHFSHALFSPAMDLAPLLKGKETHLLVKKGQHDLKQFVRKVKTAKQQRALQVLQKLPAKAFLAEGYMYDEVAPQPGPSREKDGFVLSPEVIHSYAQLCKGLKGFVRGHQHRFEEGIVKRKKAGEKVIVTTLAIGNGGGWREEDFRDQNRQGILFEVAPKVSDWKKTTVLSEGSKKNLRFSISPSSYPMYTQTFSSNY